MYFPDSFIDAFNHAMLYEVGPFWNPNDDDVIYGRIDTREQRKKVGYVNIPQDRGGETKYGIAQNSNKNIRVRDLDLDGAMDVYFREYWIRGKCDALTYPITIIHFDGCVNHGVTRASKFLQRAAGISESKVDGVIGNGTLAAVLDIDPSEIIHNISQIRSDFYQSIVNRDPSQGIFLNGWMRRINEVTEYTHMRIYSDISSGENF